MASTTTMTTTIDDIHPDILSQAFRRMDGPTLAAAACSSSLFRLLSSDPSIWREVCLSTWPSLRLLPAFPSLSHISLFADSFPSPSNPDHRRAPPPKALHSCVDIHHAGLPLFSRVVTTDTSSPWFLDSAFRIDALDRKSPPDLERRGPPISPGSLELSWVAVDAETGRAVNASGRVPVEIGQHWYTGETLVKFVTVLDECAISIVVTCGERAGQVREVSMTVEDWDGIAVSGKDGLGIMAAAMEGKRRRGRGERDETKVRYEEYVRSKRVRKEKKAKREGMMDLCCTVFGALVFLSFLMLLAFRTGM